MSRIIYIKVYAPGFDLELVPTEIYSFAYSESLHGCARWSLVVRTEKYDKFDAFFKYREDEPFMIEFGYKESAPNVVRKRVVLLESRRKTLGSAACFTFRGLCAGHLLNLKVLRDRVWKDKISRIVQEIVGECGLGVRVEETEGTYRISSGIARAGPFICQYLMPLAYSPKGNDWSLMIEDGTKVVFAPLTSFMVRHRFTDLRQHHQEKQWITLFLPELRRSTAYRPWLGYGSTAVRSYSPEKVRLVDHKVSEGNVSFRYLQGPKPAPAERSELVRLSYFHKNVNTDVEDQVQMKHEAETSWSLNARDMYRLCGLIKFDPTIKVGDVARVLIAHGKNGTHMPSTGLYLVSRMDSFYTRGEIKSFVHLIRRWEM